MYVWKIPRQRIKMSQTLSEISRICERAKAVSIDVNRLIRANKQKTNQHHKKTKKYTNDTQGLYFLWL